MKKISLRKISSLILLFSGFLMTFTGVLIYAVPYSRNADWIGWSFLGIKRGYFSDLHITISFLFTLFALVHFIYNFSSIKLYFKNSMRIIFLTSRNVVIAFFITFLVSLGTYFKTTPFKEIIDLGGTLKNSWVESEQTPPIANITTTPIYKILSQLNLDPQRVEEIFKNSTIHYEDFNQTLEDVAIRNNVSPREIYLLIKK